MTTPYSRNMPHVATYWPPGTNDGFGGLTPVGDPVVISCRWQSKITRVLSESGDEVTSDTIVYPDQEIEVGGWLAREDQSGIQDPTLADGARLIVARGSSPSLSGDVELWKVWL